MDNQDMLMLSPEVLNFAISNGMIDVESVLQKKEEMNRQEILDNCKNKPWKGKDGKWHIHLPDPSKKEGRIQIQRKTLKELEDAIVDHYRKLEEHCSVEECFNEWNERRLKLNKIKASTYKKNQDIFKANFKEIKSKDMKTLGQDFWEDFLERRAYGQDMTRKAFSNLKSVVRGMLKYARRRKLVDFPISEIFSEIDISECDFKKSDRPLDREIFDDVEFPALMEFLIHNVDIWNLGLLLDTVTGMRVGELSTLKWEDFNHNAKVHVHRTESREYVDGKPVYSVSDRPKTAAGIRDVIIPTDYRWVVDELRRINPFGEYVFMRNGVRMKGYQFRDRLNSICRKLNITVKSMHAIRKSYATILLDNKVDQAFVTSQLGHTDISCTENYYHKDIKSDEAKTNIVDEISAFQMDKRIV